MGNFFSEIFGLDDDVYQSNNIVVSGSTNITTNDTGNTKISGNTTITGNAKI